MNNVKSMIRSMIPNSIIYLFNDFKYSYYNMRMLRKHQKISKYKKGRFPYGINLIGDIQAETGLSQSMRLIASILKNNQIPFVIIQVDQQGDLRHDNHNWDSHFVKKPVYCVNLIHINSNKWAENYCRLPKDFLDYRYNIAYWLWELETFPKKWQSCIKTVDEIWAPSQFICDCLKKYTNRKPIIKIPYAIEIKEPTIYKRDHFGLPEDAFLYLMMYDQKSVSERKNPKGAIESFVKAFTPNKANRDRIGLVIKVNHVDNRNNLLPFEKQLKGYKYIYYLTDNMTRDEVESLEAVSDVLISLHRSEGFGLPSAEAMYLGTPVIATNWSATTEFMNEECACLVDYRMITINRKIGPYEKGNRWANADTDEAARYMVRLFEDKIYYDKIKENAAKHIREHFNSIEIGKIIKNRLNKK